MHSEYIEFLTGDKFAVQYVVARTHYFNPDETKTVLTGTNNEKLHNIYDVSYIRYNLDMTPNFERYYINDQLHRECGPAVIIYGYICGVKEILWYLYDKFMGCEHLNLKCVHQ
jgi:hypothetical protein